MTKAIQILKSILSNKVSAVTITKIPSTFTIIIVWKSRNARNVRNQQSGKLQDNFRRKISKKTACGVFNGIRTYVASTCK